MGSELPLWESGWHELGVIHRGEPDVVTLKEVIEDQLRKEVMVEMR